MIEFSKEESDLLESNIRNVYIEKKVTVQSEKLKAMGIFSRNFAIGLSVDIPEGMTVEKVTAWTNNYESNYLRREYEQAIKGYKRQGVE